MKMQRNVRKRLKSIAQRQHMFWSTREQNTNCDDPTLMTTNRYAL